MHKWLTGAAIVGLTMTSTLFAQQAVGRYDIVIYGGTSAGIAAAVQAKRMGNSVVLLSPQKHIGGLSASGLGWTDTGETGVIGGISREFYQVVYDYYRQPVSWKWETAHDHGKHASGIAGPDGKRAMFVFEPHVAEKIFETWVAQNQIPLFRDKWLDRSAAGITKKDGRITAIRMLDGTTYEGRIFIDASYEGDLMALAGVRYTVGREANSQYGETINGIQLDRKGHQFNTKVSGYKIPGNPASGLLPRISNAAPGKTGEGDGKIQAYNFRMCLTREPDNRVAFPKPANYDPAEYELLLRALESGERRVMRKFDLIPNKKTDTNNAGSFSTDNIGMNYDYPEASYERRAEIIAEHIRYQQGYHYFLANDSRVPKDVHDWYSQWGLAKDEFTDNGNWPYEIYVREARRMLGDVVVTENHIRQTIATERSIGMGSYVMDSHNVQRYVDEEGYVKNEGDVQVRPPAPYPIDYGAIIPKKDQCQNLMVVCAVSSSHIAYGSIRMEPVFMILGQSAATAASQAIAANSAVQDINYPQLAARLKADGQILELKKEKPK